MKHTVHKAKEAVKNNQVESAKKTFMEELFNDYYRNRRKVYKMNFIRGLFFGLGSVLGGTLVIALAIWIVTLLVDFPLVGEFFKQTQNVLEQTQQP